MRFTVAGLGSRLWGKTWFMYPGPVIEGLESERIKEHPTSMSCVGKVCCTVFILGLGNLFWCLCILAEQALLLGHLSKQCFHAVVKTSVSLNVP